MAVSRRTRRHRQNGPTPAALAATQIEKVKDNLYVITGSSPAPRESFSGGNTAVFITADGVVVVDTKLAGWGQAILDKIRTVTDKPVTTHHQHAHARRPHRQQRVLRHDRRHRRQENTKANMEKMPTPSSGDKAQFLPKRTFKDTMTLMSGTRSDRSLLLRAGPHERRRVGGVPRAARAAVGRHVRGEGPATRRLEQRRQHRRLSRYPVEGHRGAGQERRHRDRWTPARRHAKGPAGIRGLQPRLLELGEKRDEGRQDRRSGGRQYRTPAKYRGYAEPQAMRLKANVQAAYDGK